MMIPIAAAILFVAAICPCGNAAEDYPTPVCASDPAAWPCTHLGAKSFAPERPIERPAVPDGYSDCTPVGLVYIGRQEHRYADTRDAIVIASAANASEVPYPSVDPRLSDVLTPLGIRRARARGARYAAAFPEIYDGREFSPQDLYIYSSGASRTSRSAAAFGEGLFGTPVHVESPLQAVNILRAHKWCTRYHKPRQLVKEIWRKAALEIAERAAGTAYLGGHKPHGASGDDLVEKVKAAVIPRWLRCQYMQGDVCSSLSPADIRTLASLEARSWWQKVSSTPAGAVLACPLLSAIEQSLDVGSPTSQHPAVPRASEVHHGAGVNPKTIAFIGHDASLLPLLFLVNYSDTTPRPTDVKEIDAPMPASWNLSHLSPYGASYALVRHTCRAGPSGGPSELFLGIAHDSPANWLGCVEEGRPGSGWCTRKAVASRLRVAPCRADSFASACGVCPVACHQRGVAAARMRLGSRDSPKCAALSSVAATDFDEEIDDDVPAWTAVVVAVVAAALLGGAAYRTNSLLKAKARAGRRPAPAYSRF